MLVNYSHVPEAPFYTVLYAPPLRTSPGRLLFPRGQDFQGAADLDGDGTRELLFTGINNGWNWVNAVAAVRLDPRSLTRATARGSRRRTRCIEHPAQTHAPLVRHRASRPPEVPPGLAIDETAAELTVRYLSGKTWTLAFDGSRPGGSKANRADRQAARREAYKHLWEAERLRRAGMLDLAMAKAAAALGSARRAGRPGSASTRSGSRPR